MGCLSTDFGAITAAGRYTTPPLSSQVIEQFDYVYGDRTGINLFMSEEAQRAAALERGDAENLFITG